jgi:hypothetical protein
LSAGVSGLSAAVGQLIVRNDGAMTALQKLLLIVGLIFPAISWLSGIGSLVYQWRYKKHSSPVFIPFIGPILLTTWAVSTHQPLWIIVMVWVADIGTLGFLAASPALLRDWWRICSFTRVLALNGSKDNQSAIITIHSTGHYLLKKSWTRPPGQTGIVGLGEPGTFTQLEDGYELISHVGLRRLLQKTDEKAYRVEAEELPKQELHDYSLRGWVLRA